MSSDPMLINPAEVKSASQAPGTVCTPLLSKSHPDRHTCRSDLHQDSLNLVVLHLTRTTD